MSTVTHRQAQRLAALGYRGTSPGMVYVPCAVTGAPSIAYALVTAETPAVYAYCAHGGNWYKLDTVLAAPVYVSGDGQSGALEFLTALCSGGQHKGTWGRNEIGAWWFETEAPSVSVIGAPGGWYPEWGVAAANASDLLDAVLDWLEAAQLTAKEGV